MKEANLYRVWQTVGRGKEGGYGEWEGVYMKMVLCATANKI